jgi:hypothetical protein
MASEKAFIKVLHSKRYNKTTPVHHVHIDVKVLILQDPKEAIVKRFQ